MKTIIQVLLSFVLLFDVYLSLVYACLFLKHSINHKYFFHYTDNVFFKQFVQDLRQKLTHVPYHLKYIILEIHFIMINSIIGDKEIITLIGLEKRLAKDYTMDNMHLGRHQYGLLIELGLMDIRNLICMFFVIFYLTLSRLSDQSFFVCLHKYLFLLKIVFICFIYIKSFQSFYDK